MTTARCGARASSLVRSGNRRPRRGTRWKAYGRAPRGQQVQAGRQGWAATVASAAVSECWCRARASRNCAAQP
eukprot:9666669-Lingulodinium_polyedra.AAC.1